MSIPAIAIKRPVTMFMISSVIVLLGLISLFRLPVDRFNHGRMAVAGVANADAANEIQIFFSGGIKEMHAFCAHDFQGEW